MHNPFDDPSHNGSYSPLDDLVQSLSLESHQHSHLNASDALDLSHPNLNLGDTYHDLNSNHIGTVDGVDTSSHSLMTTTDALDGFYQKSLAEVKTEFHLENHLQDLGSPSTILQTNHASVHDDFLSANHSESIVDFSVKSAYTSSGAITPDDNNSVNFIGETIWWNRYGGGQVGTVDGHKFYRGGDYIGRLGADMNVYNADGNKIGYVSPSGNAYTPSGGLFATGGTARWAAATLVFNTCSVS